MSRIINTFKSGLLALRPQPSRIIRSAAVSLNSRDLSASTRLGNRLSSQKHLHYLETSRPNCMLREELNTPPSQLPRDAEFQRRINEEIKAPTIDELKFLANLPEDIRMDSHMGDQAPWYPATSHCLSLEIHANLLGLKPCTLVTASELKWSVYPELIERVWKPFFDGLQLEKYGFVLQQANDAVDMDFGGDPNGWVLADTRSTHWKNIQDEFLSDKTKYHRFYDLTTLLGYPSSEPRFNLDGSKTLIVYEDLGLTRELGQIANAEVPPVWGYSYFIAEGAEEEILASKHFQAFGNVFAWAGRMLKIWITRDPRLVNE